MDADDTTLVEHRGLARRIPEETAGECSIEVVDEPFAEEVVARTSSLGEARGRDAFERVRQLGVNERPVESFRPS